MQPSAVMASSIRIQHGSAYAHDPEHAAGALAALTGGVARAFHPCPGAWVCFLGGDDEHWSGPLIELYPRSVRLASEAGEVVFRPLPPPHTARGAGTHFNLAVGATRGELERICAAQGLTCSWRGWAGFLDVWLDDDLLIELAPAT